MKKLAIAFAATMLVFSIAAAVLWMQLQTERGNLAGLQERMAGLEDAQRAMTAAATSPPPEAPIIGASATAAILTESQEAAMPQAELSKAEKAFEQGMADARAQMSAEALRPQIAKRYPDLAKDLGLSQSDAEKFIDLVARQQGGFAAFALSVEGKSREEIWRINNARLLADEREQAAMLGGKYPQWVAYQGTVSARQMIRELQPLLGSGDDALTDVQFTPLAGAMGMEIARLTKESQDRQMAAPAPLENTVQSYSQNAAERNRRLVDAASAYLSPVQLDRFRQMLATKAEATARSVARDEAVRARIASGMRP